MKNEKSWMQLMVLLALALAWPLDARAETETVDGLTWTYTVINGKAFIGDGNYRAIPTNTSGAIAIPSFIRSYPVTKIQRNAFTGCSDLTEVTIPDSVTSIGERAFFNCSSLMNMTIPNNVASIGSNAFYNCSDLTSVAIGTGVASIQNSAFLGCSSLESFTVADENPAYKSVSGLLLTKDGMTLIAGVNGDVVIPDSVANIGSSAFLCCTNLTSVAIPDSVTSIGYYAFSNCWNLTSVTILGNVTNDWGYSTPFDNCTNLATLVLGDKMTKIGNYMFYGCSSLTNVTIPDRVTSIGNSAFAYCSGLTSVTILGNITNDWTSGPFRDCTNITTLVLGDKMTKIGSYMFCGCSGLKSVTVPDSVTSIGDAAFSGCSGLTSMTIPDGVPSIGDHAFSGCSGLTSLTVPDSVTSIGNYAFSGCSGLTSMTIPGRVTSIGNVAFRDCSGLTSVTILGNATNDWNNEVRPFYNCTNLATLVLGDKMTKIGNCMFYDCTGLRSVTIGSGVTSIGSGAFFNCHSMEAFSVSSDNPAYKSISGLLLTKDGKTLLNGVNGDVVIPDGVTDIAYHAFRNCGELTSLVIPGSVVRLPTTTFDGCDKLWTAWYRTLANLSATGGASGGGTSGGGSSGPAAQTVALTVTNVIVHYVTPGLPSGAVTPDTSSAGIVNIVAEVTANKAVAISPEWADQYPSFAATFGTDFSAALTKPTGKRDGAGNPMYVWQDYVAGTDPTDPTSVFTASVTFDAETGAPVIGWSPELTPAEAAKRLYTIYGKVRLTDPDWLPVTGDPSPYNFFRLTVEMR